VISSHILKRQLLPYCFGVLAFLVLLSGSGTNRATQVANQAFSYIDTWNNIHPFLLFDYKITNSAVSGLHYDYVSGASWYNIAAFRSTNPNITLSYYMPFHRDNGTFTDNPALQSLASWKATHPRWILYKCDRVTPAYEFGDPNVPLDFSNPNLVTWQVQNYALPASKSGYNGIVADNLNLQNLFGACGTYQNGNWVQRYTGKPNDPQWLQDVLTWVTEMQAALHNLHHPLALISNLDPGKALAPSDPRLQPVLQHIDGVLDEDGFTNYGAGDLTANAWLLKYQLGEYVQSQGKPFYSVNQFASLNRANIQWALASYLMMKEHTCAVFISKTQDYGNNAWYQEYNAQIGTPLNTMYQDQGVYWRDYSNGVSIVNPASAGTFTVNLNSSYQYVDLYGNSVGPTVTMPPHSGLVLLIQA
jgi:hypothetical protein